MGPWNDRRKPWIILALASLLLFIVGFEAGRRQAFDASLFWGGFLLQEGHALLEADDDMGLVDWSKRLERDGVAAFKFTRVLARQGGTRRVLAQGGNERRIPPKLRKSISMLLPSTVLLVLTDRVGEDALELVLLLPCASSPLTWGSLFLLLGLLCAWGGHSLRSLERGALPKTATVARDRPVPPTGLPVPPVLVQGQVGVERLLVDPGFKILEMDPGALGTLGLSPEQVQPSHLLDLLPDPAFMEAISKGGPSEWRGAFPSAPDVLVTWSKVQGGRTLLELRSTDREGPKIL